MSIFTFITDLIDRFQESQHSRNQDKLLRVNEKLTVERLREQTTDAQVQAIRAEAGMLEAKAGLEDSKAKPITQDAKGKKLGKSRAIKRILSFLLTLLVLASVSRLVYSLPLPPH